MPAARILHGDKGYESNAIRRQVEENGTMRNIPPKANRRWKNCFSPALYRDPGGDTSRRNQNEQLGLNDSNQRGPLAGC